MPTIVSGAGSAGGAAEVSGAGALVRSGTGSAAGVATVRGGGMIPPSRILIGRLPSGAWGLRISEPGYNASADPVDNRRLYFSTEWPEVMPVHQVGSAVHGNYALPGQVVTQTINFPGLGYVPFVEFIVQSNGDALPAGSDIYPTSRWYARNGLGVPYLTPLGPDGNFYLRLNITATALRFESCVRNGPSNNTFGAPRKWTIYWCIYRKRAF